MVLDASLLQRCARRDGLLLRPRTPLVVQDESFLRGYHRTGRVASSHIDNDTVAVLRANFTTKNLEEIETRSRALLQTQSTDEHVISAEVERACTDGSFLADDSGDVDVQDETTDAKTDTLQKKKWMLAIHRASEGMGKDIPWDTSLPPGKSRNSEGSPSSSDSSDLRIVWSAASDTDEEDEQGRGNYISASLQQTPAPQTSLDAEAAGEDLAPAHAPHTAEIKLFSCRAPGESKEEGATAANSGVTAQEIMQQPVLQEDEELQQPQDNDHQIKTVTASAPRNDSPAYVPYDFFWMYRFWKPTQTTPGLLLLGEWKKYVPRSRQRFSSIHHDGPRLRFTAVLAPKEVIEVTWLRIDEDDHAHKNGRREDHRHAGTKIQPQHRTLTLQNHDPDHERSITVKVEVHAVHSGAAGQKLGAPVAQIMNAGEVPSKPSKLRGESPTIHIRRESQVLGGAEKESSASAGNKSKTLQERRRRPSWRETVYVYEQAIVPVGLPDEAVVTDVGRSQESLSSHDGMGIITEKRELEGIKTQAVTSEVNRAGASVTPRGRQKQKQTLNERDGREVFV
ncbi:unnamed protein product [Amoebophrya sp. A120]|nr:unnamed protein product [Amoebophrya sp. A120]|eukprot:GSA120T00019083001.1